MKSRRWCRSPPRRRQRWPGAASLAIAAALSSGCADRPPLPEWRIDARSALDRALAAYFAGNSVAEAQEFDNLRAALAPTGQPATLGRAELVRCASRVASLVIEPCTGFAALAADAPAAERAYARYLAGEARPEDAALLPPQHRGLVGASTGSVQAVLREMADPFSRLVAASVLLQTGRADPAVVAVAVDTASEQGWRRPLLAWLGVQLRLAEAGGAADEAERIRRRVVMIESAGRAN